LNEAFETSSTIEGSRGNVAIVVIVITTLMSSMVVPVVSGLFIAVPVLSIAVLMVSGLI